MLFNKIKFVAMVVGFLCLAYLALYGGVTAVTGAPPAWAARSAANAFTPAYISYQGTLRDADDNPANGTYNMVVRIYDKANATGTALWRETHNDVDVREGRFNLLLGEQVTIPADLFSSPERYVQLTVDGVRMTPAQRFASVPYAFQAENGVPVGAVIDWWRPNGSFPVPEGYMICDGRTVNDRTSPLYDTTLPNLTEKFVRGVTDVSDIGNTGGTSEHSHGIDHGHSYDGWTRRAYPEHAHSLPSATGSVYSGGSNPTGHLYRTRDDSEGWGSDVHLRVDGGSSRQEGQHRHALGGDTGRNSDFDDGHGHEINLQIESQNLVSASEFHIPPYIGLLKLCRIK
jgi:hypothetical protein